MGRRLLHGLAVSGLLLCMQAHAGGVPSGPRDDCERVGRARDTRDDEAWARIHPVLKPGRYCLAEDVESKVPFDLSSGGRVTSEAPVWELEAAAVKIDLKGHEVSNEQRAGGAILLQRPGGSIANGVIRSGGGYGIRIGGGLYGSGFNSLRSDYAAKDMDGQLLASVYAEEVGPLTGPGRTSLQRSGLEVDRVTIEVGGASVHPQRRPNVIGVAAIGAGNSITNSRITVRGGHAGIYLFGAGQRIEGNTIVFECPGATPSAAPIKLHAGDGSVIRNNTIVVDCWSGKPEAAISLIDSRDVVIENNTVIGVSAVFKIWDETPQQRSSVLPAATGAGNRILPWWRKYWSP